MKTKGHPGKVLLVGLLSIMIFLVVLGILNIISSNVNEPSFHKVVSFINQNLILLVLISLVTLLGDIFREFIFPLNVIYPFFHAGSGALWVVFFFRIFKLVDEIALSSVYNLTTPFYFTALIVVPFIILIVGFGKIALHYWPKKKEARAEKPREKKKTSKKKRKG